VALGAGIAAGIALSLVDAGVSRAIVAVVEPFGTLFVNAIRMTVVPLVVSSLIVGVASTEDRAMPARVGGRGFRVRAAAHALGGLAALVTPPLMSNVQLDPAAVAQVRAASPSASSIAAGGIDSGTGRVARVAGAVERDRRRGGRRDAAVNRLRTRARSRARRRGVNRAQRGRAVLSRDHSNRC
jgi:hypothetical protein